MAPRPEFAPSAVSAAERSQRDRVMVVLDTESRALDLLSAALELLLPGGEVAVATVQESASGPVLPPMGCMTEMGVVVWLGTGERQAAPVETATAWLDACGVAHCEEVVKPKSSMFASRRRRFAAEALADLSRRLGARIVVVGSSDDQHGSLADELRDRMSQLVVEIPCPSTSPSVAA